MSFLSDMAGCLKVTALLKRYARSMTESEEGEEEEHKTTYKSQPFSVDPYLIAYAIEEQKKEREEKDKAERLRTVPTKSVAY